MEAYAGEWLQLLIRWVHLITGIAWIGASFYFVWLDNSLRPPRARATRDEGVGGELWAIHGGGFYHVQKFRVAPAELPPTLHWFKWEAYSTWLSGFALLVVLYWWHADVYIVDRSVVGDHAAQAVAHQRRAARRRAGSSTTSFASASGFAHERVLGGRARSRSWPRVAWGLSHVFSGRAMYLQIGAMLGTLMAANVLFVIIPAQRKLVEAKEQGGAPDPVHGLRGKQRSVHNNYFTLPVLLTMISNHYPMTFGHPHAWIVLVVPAAARRVRAPLLQPAPSRPHRVGDSADGRGRRAGAGDRDRAAAAAPPAAACRVARRAADHRRALLRRATPTQPRQEGFAAAAEGRRARDARADRRERGGDPPAGGARRARCRSATSRR